MTTTDFNTPSRLVLALAAAGLFALPGCTGDGYNGTDDPFNGNGNGNNNTDDDDSVGQAQTALTGVVRDAQGLPISGVTISADGLSATTNQDGRFFIEDMAVGERVAVNATKSGFAKNSTPLDILEGVENMILITLAQTDYVGSFDAAAGLSFEVEVGGPTIALPAGGFVDSSGNPYAGEVRVEATFYDLESDFEDGNELNATPGDFTAIDANGAFQTLESYGMVQVNLTDASGNEINVSTGAPVVMPLQGAGYADGEIIPMWSYSETEGRWMEEAQGTVVTLGDGTLAVEFTAPHFSTWNCDRPLPTHGCVTGTVRNSQGTPRPGATVRAVGISYISTTTARTNQNGEFCLEVKNGETVWVEISYSVGGQIATQRTDPVTIPGGQGTCTSGSPQNCVSIGVVDMEIMSCISGLVVTGQGQPVAGAVVAASSGGQATTDSSGFFCITSPVFTTSTINVVEGNLGEQMGFVPTQVFTQPGLPECQGGCSNVVVLRPYTGVTCAAGELMINNGPGQDQLIEVFDSNFPSTRIFATTTQQDGSFCVPVPTGVEVIVQNGGGPNLCDSVEIAANSQGQGGAQCDGGQGGECLDVGTLSCTIQ